MTACDAEADGDVLGVVDWLGDSDALEVADALAVAPCVPEPDSLWVSLGVALALAVLD